MRQCEVAESVQNVLDALEEGFPSGAVRSRCQILAKSVAQEDRWRGAAWPKTLATLLGSYVDAAVQG